MRLRYDKVLFLLDKTNELALSLRRKRVTVCDYADGRLEIQHNGVCMPYRVFDKLRSVDRAKVVENKRLDETLEVIAAMQANAKPQTRSKKAPRRSGQKNHMFKEPSTPQVVKTADDKQKPAQSERVSQILDSLAEIHIHNNSAAAARKNNNK